MATIGALVDIGGRTSQGLPGLERLLRPSEARAFADRPVTRDTLEELHALMAVGPGMVGASPTRILFATTPAAKARLAQRLAPHAREAAMLAPACAVIGYDRDFAEQLIAFAGDGAAGSSCFERPGALRAAAMRNSVLQGAYLLLSARALGLEAVFVHGFDSAAVAGEFFRGASMSAIFVAAIGYPAEPQD